MKPNLLLSKTYISTLMNRIEKIQIANKSTATSALIINNAHFYCNNQKRNRTVKLLLELTIKNNKIQCVFIF